MSPTKRYIPNILVLLKIAACGVLIGRAWQFIARGNPLLSLCYDYRYSKGIVEGFFGIKWSVFQADMDILASIEMGIAAIGLLFLITAVVLVFIERSPDLITKSLCLLSTFFLVLLSFAYYVDKGMAVGQFVEYSLQMSSPFLLYFYYKKTFSSPRFILILKIVIALTFIGHGLYAVGYYPQPGHFVQMMIDGFGMSESTAKTALIGFGILDFVAAFILFIPKTPSKFLNGLFNACIIYLIFWGFLTTSARLYTNFYIDIPIDSILEWLPDLIYRLPHFLVPLVLFILIKEKEHKTLF